MGNNHELGVFNNGVTSVERAMVERYFLCKVGRQFEQPLAPGAGAYEHPSLREFQDEVVNLVTPEVAPISLREVVEQYSGSKRRVYEAALRSLYRKRLNRRDAHLRPFTKFEKQSLLKAPRIINPRSPRYNLVLGKYLKKAEKVYFKAINKLWGAKTAHTVIKGLNSFEAADVIRAKWQRFENPVGLGLDATKFDMHVSVAALIYEHAFYNRVFNSAELRQLLEWQLVNQGVAYCADGEVEFRMPGTRSSGDLNTSLGNCIIMCALIWGLCRELGIDAELANNGDDCVLIFEREHLDAVLAAVPGYFQNLGFRMTVEEPVDTLEEVEFCQSHPVKLAGGWCMVRNVRTCLQKDPMCLMPIPNEKAIRKWFWAVGMCGQSAVPGCPVLQEFYGAFKRSGCETSKRHVAHIFRNTGVIERMTGVDAPVQITNEARMSFFRAFGITPDYQIALEDYYSKFTIGALQDDRRSGLVENQPPAFLRHL